MIGQTISHYKITAKLGAGGMGEVYLAEDTTLKRKVALKFLPEALRSDAEARERLIREAQAASKLNHKNIVTIHAVEEADGRDFIVMEYVEGQSLKEFAESGAVATDRVLKFAMHICDGLVTAHAVKVIHRDIKSDNIIVTSGGQAKIMDFGLATWRGAVKLTQEGSTVGTAAYMSPEQAQGGEVDHRADLWSVGVVLYELLSGRLPFTGDHAAAIAYAVTNETPEPLARYKADVPDALQRIVSKCLAKDPDERYQSAADLLADLRMVRRESTAAGIPVSAPSRKRPMAVAILAVAGIAILAVAVAFLTQFFRGAGSEAPAERVMLAVLPFENLGAEDQEYFAAGITEEITTRVAKISALGVISRTSAIKYKDTEKSLREIGAELGVDFVLEGTIRWDRSGTREKVRINPQLIRVADDTHLWAETYDRVLEEIFAVQTDIAEQVAAALNVALLEPERQLVAARPTDNLDAYNYYLRGIEYFDRGYTEENLRIALEMQEQAVALDSAFSLAHAKISELHSGIYWWHFDHTAERLEKARAAVDRALALDPDLPEAHLALGLYHYWGSRSYARALAEFDIAAERLPNHAATYKYAAAVYRRQGRWEDALASYKRSAELDPRSGTAAFELAVTYAPLRRFREFDEWIQRAIAITPDWVSPHQFRAAMHVSWHGNSDSARRILNEASASLPTGALDLAWSNIYVLEGDYDRALERITLPAVLRSLIHGDSASYYTEKAAIHHLRDDSALTRSYCDSALALMDARTAASLEDPDYHGGLGRVYALLGRADDAIREGQKAVELLPVERDAFVGTRMLENLAEIYRVVGEREHTIDQLEHLLSIPSWLTVSRLRIEPQWDPLRDHPRFQALLLQEDKVF